MFFRETLKKTSLVFFLSVISFQPLSAATANQNFVDQMLSDYQSISNYINGQFAKSMGFYSTLGWNTTPGTFDFLAGPRFDAGVGVGADLVSLSDLSGLPLGALLVSANVNLPSIFPIPFPVGTFRVGLMNGLDAGFRLSIIPDINLSDFGFAANSTGWGLDLRFRILEGVQVPTLTGVVSWDTMNGKFSINTTVNQTATFSDSGTPYDDSLTGNTTFTESWNLKSFGAKLMAGKDLGMIYPFCAVGFQRNSGDVSSNISGTVTEHLTSGGVEQAGSPSTITLTTLAQSSPVVFEPKFMLGFDMGEGFHWGVVAESNGVDIAGSTSFRVQF